VRPAAAAAAAAVTDCARPSTPSPCHNTRAATVLAPTTAPQAAEEV
jgi:hypothetical protein